MYFGALPVSKPIDELQCCNFLVDVSSQDQVSESLVLILGEADALFPREHLVAFVVIL